MSLAVVVFCVRFANFANAVLVKINGCVVCVRVCGALSAAYSLGLWSCGGAGLSGCCAAGELRLRERSRPGNGWGMCAEG